VWIAALVVAVLLNAGFVVVMESMVAADDVRRVDVYEAEPVDFVRTAVEERTREKDRRRTPPPKPQQVQRRTMRVDQMDASTFQDMPMPDAAFDVSSLLDLGGGGMSGAALGERVVGGRSTAAATDLASVGVNDLVPLVQLPPQYPPSALMRGIVGHVTVSFVVDERGLVTEVAVLNADPDGIFEEAARQAVLRWRFRPYRRDGDATSVVVTMRIVFDRQLMEAEASRS
jgi:protein TonB